MLIKRNPSGISADLLKEAINGDESAFKSIYNMLSGKLYSICLRYSTDDSEANDIFQEAFVNIYISLSKYRFEGSFEGWAKKIVVNTCIDYSRRRSPRFVPIEDEELYDTVSVSGFEKISTNDIIKEIQHLSIGYRTVLNLYCIDGYKHAEIAEILGISEGTSKSQLMRAKIILKQKLTSTIE